MSSIHDRDSPRPIVIPEDQTSIWVLIVISTVLFIIFWIWMIFIVRSNPTYAPVQFACSPGQCATDISTGVKICPTDPNQVMTINPATQTCNSPYTCESIQTPYALESDGSTNINGLCEPEVECRCLTQPQCGYYVTSFFTVQNGNAFDAIQPQRIVFQQQTSGLNADDNFVNQPPYALLSSTNQFCSIPNEWLERTWPPVLQDANLPVYQKLGPCLLGTMAYVPDDPTTFNIDSVDTTPLSCVQGTPCQLGLTPVWNNREYQVDCVSL